MTRQRRALGLVLLVVAIGLASLRLRPILLVNVASIWASKVAVGSRPTDNARAAHAIRIALDAATNGQPSGRTDLAMRMAEAYVYEEQWTPADDWYARFRAAGGDAGLATARLKALALAHHWCGQQDDGLRAAVEQLSDAVTAYRIMGDVCMGDRKYDAAISAYRQSFERRPQYEVGQMLASALVARAEQVGIGYAAAIDCYREVVDVLTRVPPTGPTAAAGYYALAQSYWKTNRFDQALASYSACVTAVDGASSMAFTCALHLGYANAAWLPPERQDVAVAAAYFEQSLTIARAAGLNAQEAEFGLGGAYLRLGRTAAGRKHLEDAVRLGPNTAIAASAREVLDERKP